MWKQVLMQFLLRADWIYLNFANHNDTDCSVDPCCFCATTRIQSYLCQEICLVLLVQKICMLNIVNASKAKQPSWQIPHGRRYWKICLTFQQIRWTDSRPKHDWSKPSIWIWSALNALSSCFNNQVQLICRVWLGKCLKSWWFRTEDLGFLCYVVLKTPDVFFFLLNHYLCRF